MKIQYPNNSLIVKDLLHQDPALAPIFEKTKAIAFSTKDNYFLSLVSTIVYQQLSGKVAASIYRKLEAFFLGEITPEKLLVAIPDELRGVGLSYRKIEYLQSIAFHVINRTVDLENIQKMSDEDIIRMLCLIKGIGPWSAQMFLLFSLGRENVFSSLDLGLRNALSKLHNRTIGVEEAEKMSALWSPYKSVVSHFLWHYLDN